MNRFAIQRSPDRPSTQAVHRRTASALFLGVMTIAIAVGCESAMEAPTVPTVGPATAAVSGADTIADGYVLGCPPRPTVAARQVTPNTADDANGNGVVCDEDIGTPDVPATRTLDDVFLPIGIVTAVETQVP